MSSANVGRGALSLNTNVLISQGFQLDAQSAATRAGPGWDTVPSRIMGTKAGRHAARERVSAFHQAQLAELLSHVAAAIDRYRDGEIDACAVDETIHHYHRAAGQLWKFCFSRGGRPHDRRRRNHRLVGTRHTATAPVITTYAASPALAWR